MPSTWLKVVLLIYILYLPHTSIGGQSWGCEIYRSRGKKKKIGRQKKAKIREKLEKRRTNLQPPFSGCKLWACFTIKLGKNAKSALYLPMKWGVRHIYIYTHTPVRVTRRLPFVSRCFCGSIRVRGRWNIPKWWLVRFISLGLIIGNQIAFAFLFPCGTEVESHLPLLVAGLAWKGFLTSWNPPRGKLWITLPLPLPGLKVIKQWFLKSTLLLNAMNRAKPWRRALSWFSDVKIP